MIFLSTLLISLFITLALIPIFRAVAVKLNAIDIPDSRKVHLYPMPKTGGIAMAIGVLVPVLLWIPGGEIVRAVLIGAAIVVLFGLLDDFRGLGYQAKFAAQVAAALVVVFYGGLKIKSLGMLLPDDVLLPDWVAIPLTIIVVVGVTNAINLADGLDGLAGGISILSFMCIGYLAYRAGNMVVALLSVAMVGAIFGFLRFNTYPATLFMGDSGSQFLGFLAITLSLALTQSNAPLSPLLPLMLLGFPVLDTMTVMLERLAEGRSPFLADKNHFHHKLLRLGLFHTEAVFVIYILQAFLVTSAFIFRFYSDWFLLIFYIVFSGLILSAFLVTDKTGWKFKRYALVDDRIKGKLRILKEKQILVKVSFSIVRWGLPLLLLFTCFLPTSIPSYSSYLSMGFFGLILMTWLLKKEWLGTMLGVTLYLLTPFVIYFSQANMMSWMSIRMVMIYNLSFGILALFVILTVKSSRRVGFKTSPMHFLILFIALVVPNLPDERIQTYHMGLLAAKIIVLFFSCEILIGELRGELNKLGMATTSVLAVMSVRGFMG